MDDSQATIDSLKELLISKGWVTNFNADTLAKLIAAWHAGQVRKILDDVLPECRPNAGQTMDERHRRESVYVTRARFLSAINNYSLIK